MDGADSGRLTFEALYYSERLTIINPTGDVGIVTLWTPVKTALAFLERNDVDLNPETSRIAVISNLYGDGLPQMIRNLLWNPQITALLAFGQDLEGSAGVLENLLTKGVETVERMGKERFLIKDTNRYLDTAFPPEHITGHYAFARFGKPSEPDVGPGIISFLENLPPQTPPTRERIEAPIPTYKPTYLPSEPRAHTIVRRHPLDAWEELVFRLMRYGIPSVASKTKERLELQNVKVVITEPAEEAEADLDAYGYSLEAFHEYQESLLAPDIPETMSYGYGNRLRGYWQARDGRTVDTLVEMAKVLEDDPTSRGAYTVLWDPSNDLVESETKNSPCLVTLFFRVFQDQLTLTATFRAHNTMSAWMKNIYGLMRIQRFVAEKAGGLPIGAMTVISHSISIDPTVEDKLSLAQDIRDAKVDDMEKDREAGKRHLREDPNGYFAITSDPERNVIIADLKMDGDVLQRYEGRTAQEIEVQIARDEAITVLSHALYVGRELTRQEESLKRSTQSS